MLDTLLELGKKLRESPDGLRHHRYIKKAPLGDEKLQIAFWQVPVKSDYSFDFSQIELLKDETRKNLLFYLNFKNGEADSSKPYVFGDVFRLYTAKEKKKRDGKTEIEVSESGNFMFGNPTKNSWSAINSFLRYKDGHIEAVPVAQAEVESSEVELREVESPTPSKSTKKNPAVAPANPLLTQEIHSFRASFRRQLPEILDFLSKNPLSYIHFNFDGKGWWELAGKDAIEKMLLENFIVPSKDGFVLEKFVYKTIISAEKWGWRSTPGFSPLNDYKTRLFQSEEILDLLYALRFASKSAVPRIGDIKIVVLPRGDNLTAKQIERFFEKTGLEDEEGSEDQLEVEAIANEVAEQETAPPENGFDPTFGMLPLNEDIEPNLLQFDFVFSNGAGKQDIDLLEIAGLSRSKLYGIAVNVRKAAEKIKPLRDEHLQEGWRFVREKVTDKNVATKLGKQLKQMAEFPPRLTQSFLNILGSNTKAQPKYQSHLLKVLPEIYTATYFDDPVLLPAFIEKIEFNVRNDEGLGFNLLKWDFFFLSQIQNTNQDRLMDIRNSQSYQVGFLLGQLARGLRSKINSFDKNYAGLISRRISNLPDVVRLHVEINQKLIMHNKVGLSFKVSPKLTELLKTFDSSREKYNKDFCAFGFFESYFAPYKSEKEEAQEEEVPPAGFVATAEDDTTVELSA
jgi:hypothetical protein